MSFRRMWTNAAVVLTIGGFLVAPAVASNLGYWERLDLESAGATQGVYWLSLPYLYTPLDEATGLYQSWVVGSAYGTPFTVDLTRGVGVDLTCPDFGTCSWSWTPPTR